MVDDEEGTEIVLTGYDDARIAQVFDALALMQVELDPDPLAGGPKRLNAKVAEARGMLSACERTFGQVSKDLLALQRRHRSRETEFKIRMDDLFANDPETRAGRNVSDREALARTKLKEEVQEIARLANLAQDLAVLMTVIKAKRADLRDVMGRLKDQMRLCQEETGLGAQWGSRVPGASPLAPGIGRTVIGSGMEMAQVLAGVQSEIHLAKAEGVFPNGKADTGDSDKEALRALARAQDATDEDPFVEIVVPSEQVEAVTTGHKPEVSMAAEPFPATELLGLDPKAVPTLATPVSALREIGYGTFEPIDPNNPQRAMGALEPRGEVRLKVDRGVSESEPVVELDSAPESEPDAVPLPGATATTLDVEDFLSFGFDEVVPGASKIPALPFSPPPQDDVLDALIDKFDEMQRTPR